MSYKNYSIYKHMKTASTWREKPNWKINNLFSFSDLKKEASKIKAKNTWIFLKLIRAENKIFREKNFIYVEGENKQKQKWLQGKSIDEMKTTYKLGSI